jgi:hypothetical protein
MTGDAGDFRFGASGQGEPCRYRAAQARWEDRKAK